MHGAKRRDHPSPRQQRRKQLDEAVKKHLTPAKAARDHPRLVLDLAEAGHQHDRKTIAEEYAAAGIASQGREEIQGDHEL